MSLKSTSRLYIEREGHDVVLTTYAEGELDEYKDPIITSTSSTISAIRKKFTPGVNRTASGAIPVGDAVFWVKDTATIYYGGTTTASVITDDGEDYVVVDVDDQRNGAFTVTVEKKRP